MTTSIARLSILPEGYFVRFSDEDPEMLTATIVRESPCDCCGIQDEPVCGCGATTKEDLEARAWQMVYAFVGWSH